MAAKDRRGADGNAEERGAGIESLKELSRLAAELAAPLEPLVARAADLILRSLAAGGKVLACGNGGSAADAQHFTAELVGRMGREREPLPALSLSSDPSVVTALSNDYGYERVFERQVEALGRPGDVLVVLTTSGRSPNVLRASEAAKRKGMAVVALLGLCPESPLGASDVAIAIPNASAQRVQELHTAVLHAVCDRVERGAGRA
jgi:phosphoheptose isomerase